MNYARYVPGATVANTQQRRPFADFGEVLNAPSDGTSSYNALQIIRGAACRAQLLVRSQLYLVEVDGHRFEDATPGQGTPLIPTSLSANRGLSDFDIPHRFVASYVWSLPRLKNSASLSATLLEGGDHGHPDAPERISVQRRIGQDNSRSGDGIDYANLVGNPYLDTSRPNGQLVHQYFNTSAFAPNPLGTFGTSPRNIMRGPGFANFDLGLMKNFAVTERTSLQFRAEAFNVLNRPNFGIPVANLNASNFGAITSASSPRIIQFALKLSF